MTYILTNVTDHDGNIKQDFLQELRDKHPEMKGKLLYPLNPGLIQRGMYRLCLFWTDGTEMILRTSLVTDCKHQNDEYMVTTLNSIYTLRQVEK